MSKWSKLQDVDLKLLRVFAVIVEHGGFSSAQFALNLSKSTMSEYVKALEVRLGVTLCQRGPKGFKLYAAGQEVYQAAKDMFAAIEMFQNTVVDINKGHEANLVIVVQDGIIRNPACRLHAALAAFSTLYPATHVTMETMLGFQVLGRVADGLAAIGVAIAPDRPGILETRYLFDEPAGLFCGVGHPLFLARDDDHAAIDGEVRGHRYCNRGRLEVSLSDILHDAEQVSVGDVGLGGEAQLALILSGRNIGYLALDTARRYVERGQLRKLNVADSVNSSRVAMMTGPHTRKSKVAQAFAQQLVKAHAAPALEPIAGRAG